MKAPLEADYTFLTITSPFQNAEVHRKHTDRMLRPVRHHSSGIHHSEYCITKEYFQSGYLIQFPILFSDYYINSFPCTCMIVSAFVNIFYMGSEICLWFNIQICFSSSRSWASPLAPCAFSPLESTVCSPFSFSGLFPTWRYCVLTFSLSEGGFI